ncbi:MAG: efflux RND transporter permease subunit, partial [Melioribacteraceae bacterium]|nr:efflux RND transporter permease subunit [Melioribacteraceae bacterium]
RKLSDLENIVVRTNGPIRLKDISKIYFGVKEEDTYSRVNGKSSVTIRLTKDSQANLIDLSHDVLKIIDKLNSNLSVNDAEIVVQQNQAETMEENINSIISLALTGGLLAIIVLWLFLKRIKLVLTIGLAVPISIFTAFNFFYSADISINSLTLIGIALAVGMLLDNSVVVLENIYRLYAKGESRIDAVINGTKEVSRSIIAATLTTVTVFLPFIFSENYLISTFGTHIGVSIISTLLVSLVLSLVLIPMLTHIILRNKTSKNISFKQLGLDNRLLQIYLVLLKSCMRFPARTIIGAVLLFFASVFIALAISVNVTEEVETDTFNLYVQMPQGSSLDNSDETAKKVEERLTDVAEIQDVISKVYEDQSTITLKLKENFKEIDKRDITKIKEDISSRVNNIGDAEISFDEPANSDRFRGGAGAAMGNRFQSMLGIGAQTEQVVIKGTSYEQMVKTADDIKYYLENLSSVQSARVSSSGQRPEVGMYFDPLMMSEYDITPTDVARELATFRSQFSSNTKFKDGTEEYDITIRIEGEEENTDKSMDDLRRLKIADSKNSLHELQEFSRLVYTKGLSSIKRVNQEKQVEVTYHLLSEVNDSKTLLDQARTEIDEMIATIPILPGIAVEVVHEDNDFEEYYFLIFVAILFIYFILASVFESLITPLILMFSIPLAAIVTLIALILTGNSLLNSNTLTGFLILLGVVVNNGIILIDFTNILKKRGYSNQRALIVAGMARVRPILITALTTIVAMLPLALGDMEYVQSIGAPFAITVIGGLSVSTLFTLVFIPTFYSGLYSSLKWLQDLDWKIKVAQSISFIV